MSRIVMTPGCSNRLGLFGMDLMVDGRVVLTVHDANQYLAVRRLINAAYTQLPAATWQLISMDPLVKRLGNYDHNGDVGYVPVVYHDGNHWLYRTEENLFQSNPHFGRGAKHEVFRKLTLQGYFDLFFEDDTPLGDYAYWDTHYHFVLQDGQNVYIKDPYNWIAIYYHYGKGVYSWSFCHKGITKSGNGVSALESATTWEGGGSDESLHHADG